MSDEKVFLLPDVGEGLTEAEIVTWKVAVGDTVALNQPLVDIETAKAVVELPSPFAGVVSDLHGAVGDTIDVGQPLITFDGATTEAAAEPAAATPAAPAPVEGAGDDVPGPSPSPASTRSAVLVGYGVAEEEAVPTRRHRRRGSGATSAPGPAPHANGRAPRSTPPVRLYAKQHGLDITTVVGTGREGLITRADVESALAGAAAAPRPGIAPSSPSGPSRFVGRELASWEDGPAEERIPVKGTLKSMAESMVASAFSAPHAAAWLRVDATRTVQLLDSLRSRASLAGVRLSPLSVVAMALCDAARHYPGVNSSFDDAAGEVVVRRRVNLGIAADTPRGLIVPNVKDADRLGLVEMARAINELVDRARQNTTSPAEMAGTTLTITNVGPLGVDGAMPILPPGTGAIVAVGQVAPAPWVEGDAVVVRQVVELAMSFDHRMIDGAMASRVLAHVGRFVSDPAPALIAG